VAFIVSQATDCRSFVSCAVSHVNISMISYISLDTFLKTYKTYLRIVQCQSVLRTSIEPLTVRNENVTLFIQTLFPYS